MQYTEWNTFHIHTHTHAYVVQNFQYHITWLVRLCARVHLWALIVSVLKYHRKKVAKLEWLSTLAILVTEKFSFRNFHVLTLCMYVYVYIYIYTHTYIHIHIYTYILRFHDFLLNRKLGMCQAFRLEGRISYRRKHKR